MADNIRIVGNIVDTINISRYNNEDINLTIPTTIRENFGGKDDYVEFYIYDIGNNLLSFNYNYLNYKLPQSFGLTPSTVTQPDTTGNIQTTNVGIESTLSPQTGSLYPIIEIDPVNDLQTSGYSAGEFSIIYNFFTNKLSNYIDSALYIEEISQDRTEVRLSSTSLTDDEIETVALSMIDNLNNNSFTVDYLLNFGENRQYVAINVALNRAVDGYEILFKLYEPLPLDIVEKATLWVVEEKVAPYNFKVNLDKLVIPPPPPTLRGPKFDIPLDEQSQGTISTAYTNYSTLVSNLQSLQNSSYQQLLNLITSQSISINVDYSNFSNFVFFGSAYQRVNNFYNKVKEIENYNNLIATYTPLTASSPNLITQIDKLTSDTNNIISQFDGFESYLYFNGNGLTLTSSVDYSTTPYPKSGSIKPLELLPTGDISSSLWFTWIKNNAFQYDELNYNNLEYAVPLYVRENSDNQPFLTFLNMVGHYFDNIWVYFKAITDINAANNNLEVGISKDVVYERLKSLGLKLYNSQAGESVDQFLIGANTGNSVFDNDFSITGSYLNNIPRKDLVAELYKRIYHNLPLLLKTKGTVTGLEHLITTFGLTGSILNVKEFGGSNKAELIKGYNNDKVRIVSNIIEGNVLSPIASLQSYPTAAADFRDSDLHYIDISFSPESQIDTHVSKSIAATNPTWLLDDYIGDPRQQYSSSYIDLDAQRKLYFETGVPGGLPPFTGSALEYSGFVRLMEYFDNSLFKMLNDFVPERASLSTGITINSPVLERNKAVYANPTPSTTQSVQEANYHIGNISSQYGTLFNNLGADKRAFYDGDITGSTVDIGQYFEDNYNPYTGDWNVFNLQNPPTKSINLNSFLHSDWNVLLNNVSQSVTSRSRRHIEYIWGTTGSILTPAELQDSYLSLRSYNVSRYEGSKVTSLLYNTYTPSNYEQIVLTPDFPSPGQTILLTDNWFTFNSSYTDSKLVNKVITSIKANYIAKLDTTLRGIVDLEEITDYTFNATTGTITFTPTFINSLPFAGAINITTITISTGIYDGDNSYGKTAAIDRYTRKIGLFTQIASSSLLPKRNNVSLKYLIDEFGGLIDLNSLNKNWMDVQRTFLMDDSGSVALFDNKKYSNQKATDGIKLIFDSGYTYTPILYASGSDSKLYFDYSGEPISYLSTAINSLSPYFIYGNSSLQYPFNNPTSRTVTKFFNLVTQGSGSTNGLVEGKSTSPFSPVYTVPEGGNYQVSTQFAITMQVPSSTPSATFTWDLYVYKGTSPTITLPSQKRQIFSFTNTNSYNLSINSLYYETDKTDVSKTPYIPQSIKSTRDLILKGKFYGAGTTFYQYTAFTQPDSGGCRGTTQKTVYSPTKITSVKVVAQDPSSTCLLPPPLKLYQASVNSGDPGFFEIPNFLDPPSGTPITKTFNYTGTFSCNPGDEIQATLILKTIAPSTITNYTASLSDEGSYEVKSLTSVVGNYPFIQSNFFTTTTQSDTIVMSLNLSNFYDKGYQFLPYFGTGSSVISSSLYSQYGDVDYPFQLNKFDIFAMYNETGKYFEARIIDIYKVNNQVYVKLSKDLPSSFRGNLEDMPDSQLKSTRFLFIKRVEDETNALLTFVKRPGLTSYGFLIPENLAPDVLANIDTITKQVKQKLLADQQGTTSTP